MDCFGCLQSIFNFFKPKVYYQVEVLLLGFKNSGKTSFLKALETRNFESDLVPTLNTEITSINLDVEQLVHLKYGSNSYAKSPVSSLSPKASTGGSPNSNGNLSQIPINENSPLIRSMETENTKLIMTIYDLSGQIKRQYLWNDILVNRQKTPIDCVIYMIDLVDSLTLDKSREKLIEMLTLNNENQKLPFMVLFNKLDMIKDWEIFIDSIMTRNLSSKNSKINTTSVNDSTNRNNVKMKTNSIDSNTNRPIKKRVKSRLPRFILNDRMHLMLMEYLGISMNEDTESFKIFDKTQNIEIILDFELAIFVTSLKQMNNSRWDDLESIIEWIVGDI